MFGARVPDPSPYSAYQLLIKNKKQYNTIFSTQAHERVQSSSKESKHSINLNNILKFLQHLTVIYQLKVLSIEKHKN